jgi:glyoxylase-like metal-dependent hydrolase (beta-lactamase superfamily II)/rhodanese-related sulfurtransferase
MKIEELNRSNCKTYLLVSNGHAALVDPVRERVADYRKELDDRGVQLDLLIETHMHADHLMINREIKESLGAALVMHRQSPSPFVDQHVEDGDQLKLGSEPIEFMHTPGHTPDSMCFVTGGAVLTGDTLLIGGSGRTDFPGGDAGEQYDAVTQKLFTLPDETLVFPGHDYKGNTSSTIGEEKRTNKRFLRKSRQDYIQLMAKLGIPLPDRIQEALQINQSGFEADEVAFARVEELASVSETNASTVFEWLHSPSRPLVLDVREPEEFVGDLGHIEGAILVPMDALERRLPKLAGYVDRDVVVVCRAGVRSASVAAILQGTGFHRVANLKGGMLEWTRRRLPVQR